MDSKEFIKMIEDIYNKSEKRQMVLSMTPNQYKRFMELFKKEYETGKS